MPHERKFLRLHSSRECLVPCRRCVGMIQETPSHPQRPDILLAPVEVSKWIAPVDSSGPVTRLRPCQRLFPLRGAVVCPPWAERSAGSCRHCYLPRTNVQRCQRTYGLSQVAPRLSLFKAHKSRRASRECRLDLALTGRSPFKERNHITTALATSSTFFRRVSQSNLFSESRRAQRG